MGFLLKHYQQHDMTLISGVLNEFSVSVHNALRNGGYPHFVQKAIRVVQRYRRIHPYTSIIGWRRVGNFHSMPVRGKYSFGSTPPDDIIIALIFKGELDTALVL